MKGCRGSKNMSIYTIAGVFLNTTTLMIKDKWRDMPKVIMWAGFGIGLGLIVVGIYRRRDVLLGIKKHKI